MGVGADSREEILERRAGLGADLVFVFMRDLLSAEWSCLKYIQVACQDLMVSVLVFDKSSSLFYHVPVRHSEKIS